MNTNAAQQTLSKAREQAAKLGYPTYQLITSTPNGVTGDGEWFYKRWNNSVDSDLIFNDDKWDKSKEIENIVNDPSKNSFIGVQYHWSEDPTKNQKWYEEQCQEIDDERTINQELDLLFVGTQKCIFSDTTLASFSSEKPKEIVQTHNMANLNVFEENPNPNDYYLIGCDTAESLEGAYCAIQIFSFKDFNQIAELEHKYGSYTLFGQDIDFVFRWLRDRIGTDNIILCNENNTIGRAPIEHLIYHTDEDIEYLNYLYVDVDFNEVKKKNNLVQTDKIGIKTTGLTKPLMVGCLLEYIKENGSGFKSQRLINQFSNIEKTNTGNIKSAGYTDLFMSACFCAYVRNKRAIQIMPIISMNDPGEYAEQQLNNFSNIIGMGNVKNISKQKEMNEKSFMGIDEEFGEEEAISAFEESNDQSSDFLPFFTL